MAKKILIIDDDSDFREAVSNLLETNNYEVSIAFNGEEGFEKAKKNIPDLILLDVMMTRKTEGFDIAKKFKQELGLKDVPVIIVSGIRKELNLPFEFEPDDDCLPVIKVLEKPIKPDLLLQTVAENIK